MTIKYFGNKFSDRFRVLMFISKDDLSKYYKRLRRDKILTNKALDYEMRSK